MNNKVLDFLCNHCGIENKERAQVLLDQGVITVNGVHLTNESDDLGLNEGSYNNIEIGYRSFNILIPNDSTLI